MDRHCVTRYLNKAATDAGIGHVHPHQMRHTLATQAINRGMSLEAIAAMLGHHSMDMTLRYAKIANRTVADEYFAVTEKVEALYGQQPSLPADTLGANMARLRREHFRLLGNGYCARPAELDMHLRSRLRELHILPNQHRLPADPASPTRRRRSQEPNRPTTPVQRAPRRPARRRIMIHTAKP